MQAILPAILIVLVPLGPALSSFFGVVVMRGVPMTKVHRDASHSACDHCGHRLYWYDLVPLLSFILLRGKCRYCGKPIAPQLFFSEVFGLIFFAFLAYTGYRRLMPLGWEPGNIFVALLIELVVLGTLLYLSIYDIFTFSIPVFHTQLLTLFAVVVNGVILLVRFAQPAFMAELHLGYADNLVAGVLAGLGVWLIIFLTKQKGMGQGDIYIALLLGLMLGGMRGVSAFYVTIFSATAVGLIYALKRGRIKGLQVPLVPFMSLGYVVALALGDRIFSTLFFAL